MNIYTRVYRAVAADVDAAEADIAAAVLRQATKAELLPLIVAEVRREKRKRVRVVEQRHGVVLIDHFRKASQVSVSGQIRAADSGDRLARFREFFDQPIRLFDGTSTTWGKATIDELRQRRAELVEQRAGIDRTVRLLDDAIDVLESSGVERLADLPTLEKVV